MTHLAVEDGNSQHRFLSQLDSNTSVNMVAYDRRQNKGKSNRAKNNNGREREQNKSRVQTSSSTAQPSRKPPGMEGKCMRCGRPEHQQGEKCAARNAKCKDCHKIGHFYKVCQLRKRTRRANLAQVTPQDEDGTYIDECGYTQPQLSYTQPNPPVVNMLKVINHTGTTSGKQFLKFPIDVNPRGAYKHHLEVSINTGADVNCMNEKTFKKLFPEVELSVCPHSIQNFGNSTADVYILGQFRVYLQFRGRKYLNTFIVTNANDCPNILSHGAIFRMGILVPNYQEENVVKLEDMETGTSNDRVHSNRERMGHTRHFPAYREVRMNNHLTQTTERTQGQHLLPDFIYRHAEFPSDMESAPNFPGKQILQGNEANTLDFLGNQFQQENEKTIDTGTRISPTNEQIIPVTHKEPHVPSRPLKTMVHRYRHTEKEVHLLSEPPELRPLKAMAHRYTRKEDHLLLGPSEFQPTEDSEV